MLHLALWSVKNGRHFVNQWDAKLKAFSILSLAFSRALGFLHVFSINSSLAPLIVVLDCYGQIDPKSL